MLLEVGAGLEVDTSCRKAVAASSAAGTTAPGRLPPAPPPLPDPAELRAPPLLARDGRRRAPHGTSPGSAASSLSAAAEPAAAGCASSAVTERRARWGATSVSIRPRRSNSGAMSPARCAALGLMPSAPPAVVVAALPLSAAPRSCCCRCCMRCRVQGRVCDTVRSPDGLVEGSCSRFRA